MTEAAQIAAVKGKKILISGSDVEANKLYYVVFQGKKKGIIKVLKLKGNKALGILLKGQALKGSQLALRASKNKQQISSTNKYEKYSGGVSGKPSSQDSRYSRSQSLSKNLGLGLILGYNMNSADVSFNNGTKDSLSGSSIGFKLFGDYSILENISLRAQIGSQPFEAEGNPLCNARTCVMSINYLGADLWARYMINPSNDNMKLWVGAGAGLVFPLDTGNTNAVVASEVGSTLMFGFGGGLDLKVGDKFYMPISLEYGLLPSSDEVSTSMFSIRAGLGMYL